MSRFGSDRERFVAEKVGASISDLADGLLRISAAARGSMLDLAELKMTLDDEQRERVGEIADATVARHSRVGGVGGDRSGKD